MTRSTLQYAPLITPLCGVLGSVVAMSLVQPPFYDAALMLGFAFVGALILGIPAGALFWAMRCNASRNRNVWTGIMLAYCIFIFAVFYLPIYSIGSV
jgi:hypothetical protein